MPAKTEVLTIPANTFSMKVEGKTFTVSVPEISIPQDKLPEVIGEYIKVLASQTARYAAVKAAQNAEEFENEVRSHMAMAESLLNRKLTSEEINGIRKKIADAKNFHGATHIVVNVESLKSRLNL